MNQHPEPGTLQHRDWLVGDLCDGLKVTSSTALLPAWLTDINTMFEAIKTLRETNEALVAKAAHDAAKLGSEAAKIGCAASGQSGQSGQGSGQAQPQFMKAWYMIA